MKAKAKKHKNAEVQAAIELDRKIRTFVQGQRAHWFEMGAAALSMERTKAFRLIGYKSFEDWQASLGKSRSLVFEAKALVKAFEKIPASKKAYLLAVPKENLKLLAKLPDRQKFSEQYLSVAARAKGKELRTMLDGKGYHVGETTSYKFSGVPNGVIPLVEKAHTVAKRIVAGRDDLNPLEVICSGFLDYMEAKVKADVWKKLTKGV